MIDARHQHCGDHIAPSKPSIRRLEYSIWLKALGVLGQKSLGKSIMRKS